MRTRVLLSLLAAALMVAVTPTVASAAGQEKASVCHDGDAGIELISIADPAVDKHLEHGDALPGDPIANRLNFVYGPDCEPVPVPLDATMEFEVSTECIDELDGEYGRFSWVVEYTVVGTGFDQWGLGTTLFEPGELRSFDGTLNSELGIVSVIEVVYLEGEQRGTVTGSVQLENPCEPPDIGDCDAPAAPGVDWHNCDKSGVDLSGVDLSGADLSGANLSGTILYGADLSGADLSGANLTGTYLPGGPLPGDDAVNLSDANLSGVDLTGGSLLGQDLSGLDLSDVILTGASLYEADLSGADLSGVDLTGATLHQADLSGADLSGANLTNANLFIADLSGANLSGANLTGADLTLSSGYPSDVTGITYSDTTCAYGAVVSDPDTCYS